MKRLVLLSLAALMLAATVFAPVAMAQEPGDVDIQSVTLGTGGTAIVTGTIQCAEGMYYQVGVELRQTTGNRPYNVGYWVYPEGRLAACQTTGPEPFTINVVGQKPFKKGNVLVISTASVCTYDPSGSCTQNTVYEEFRIS